MKNVLPAFYPTSVLPRGDPSPLRRCLSLRPGVKAELPRRRRSSSIRQCRRTSGSAASRCASPDRRRRGSSVLHRTLGRTSSLGAADRAVLDAVFVLCSSGPHLARAAVSAGGATGSSGRVACALASAASRTPKRQRNTPWLTVFACSFIAQPRAS